MTSHGPGHRAEEGPFDHRPAVGTNRDEDDTRAVRRLEDDLGPARPSTTETFVSMPRERASGGTRACSSVSRAESRTRQVDEVDVQQLDVAPSRRGVGHTLDGRDPSRAPRGRWRRAWYAPREWASSRWQRRAGCRSPARARFAGPLPAAARSRGAGRARRRAPERGAGERLLRRPGCRPRLFRRREAGPAAARPDRVAGAGQTGLDRGAGAARASPQNRPRARRCHNARPPPAASQGGWPSRRSRAPATCPGSRPGSLRSQRCRPGQPRGGAVRPRTTAGPPACRG
jgi:hypothetical protein